MKRQIQHSDDEMPESIETVDSEIETSAKNGASRSLIKRYKFTLTSHKKVRRQITKVLKDIENDLVNAEKGRTMIYGLNAAINAIKAQQSHDLSVASFLAGLSETQLLGIQQIMGQDKLTPNASRHAKSNDIEQAN